ncbi:NADP(H)-dependent aldo-keto reductase [Methylobacillus gramineus]|uniref:NADP(H)-dependent aldo-keto reductase n=1 Tax=Methylobacillus gramineus TaxID=755169 RepID=UPI001CFFF657|nr:NADP(H)-dependent aldo-keto reductase [Methylobacillus gramineus]MCB5185265.1 NADP(H)-dependent aldo-keto reductase [Methylobacillus gramineus]
MEYRKLGQSDLNVSAICLGTMTYGDQNTEAEGHEQLDYALAQGINFIDTAEMYPVPPKADTVTRTETIIGSWLKKQARDKIILASKVAGGNRKMEWIRGGPQAVDRANVRAAIEGSLKRLQTDYLDLYQIHWPERNVPIFGQYQFDPSKEKEWVSIHNQLETLAELVKEGKVRYIGVSNEQPWGVMEFIRLSNQYNLPRIASIQNSYSLLNRGFEFGMTEIAYREQLSLTAYSPLAFGHLTGKYIDNPKAQGRVNLFPGYAQRYTKPNVTPASAAYAELARKHGLTPTELALGFVYHRWFVTSTIIGATSLPQLTENIGAWQTPLSSEIMQEIEHIHLRYMNPAP